MDWIKGYADGSFKPDNNITRAEVVTIVNRVTDREADTEYVNKNLSSPNLFDDLTDKGYWAYYPILKRRTLIRRLQTLTERFGCNNCRILSEKQSL